MPDTVYVLRAGPFLKVGFTSDSAESRIKSLMTGCPFRIVIAATVPGTSTLERYIHSRLHEYRANGEWFRDTWEARAICREHGLIIPAPPPAAHGTLWPTYDVVLDTCAIDRRRAEVFQAGVFKGRKQGMADTHADAVLAASEAGYAEGYAAGARRNPLPTAKTAGYMLDPKGARGRTVIQMRELGYITETNELTERGAAVAGFAAEVADAVYLAARGVAHCAELATRLLSRSHGAAAFIAQQCAPTVARHARWEAASAEERRALINAAGLGEVL